MKLWDKGISIDTLIENFTVGNDREVDLHIAKYDVQASLAHAQMLAEVGIITDSELSQLTTGLNNLKQQIENGEFTIESAFEDVHSKIEYELTKTYGDVGKKIHTARSRNDQVLVALQLYYKEHLQQLITKTTVFIHSLLELAETHKNKLLPGYTHLQVAMPSSFGLWFSAYAEVLIDDIILLKAALKVVDQNPLGSAAGYGSSFPIDREFTTQALYFSTLKYNVVAAQLGRGKSERVVANAIGQLANTLSRFAMDVCLYNSQNFGFIAFPDELTTGSSIMPHKKNPDVFELIRAKSNQIQSVQNQLILLTNNLPSGYHRDFQLLKEPIINAINDVDTVLEVFDFAICKVQVKEINLNDDKYKYLFTVDNINTLVENGIPFREAYKEIGSKVENGTYKPNTSKQHTHIGSIHNLQLKAIKEKLTQVVEE